MRGTHKQRKMAARFGPKWWDRYGHMSTYSPYGGWITWGLASRDDQEGFRWPRPAKCCIESMP